MSFFHGRHVGSLLTLWATVLVLAGVVYWLQLVMPALIDMLAPFYVVLILAIVVGTWKWFRWRAKGGERRHGNRRHTDRRHAPDDTPL